MRLVFSILITLMAFATAYSQAAKPRIIGQKDLSVVQGKDLTIQLTDLYVEETVDGGNNNGGGSGGSGDGDDSDDGKDEDDDDDRDEDEEQEDRDEDEEQEDRDEDEDDHEDNDKGKNKGKNKGDGKGKNDGEKDKDDEGKGKGKDKGKGKGKGNGRSSYPDGYTLEIFGGDNYSFSGNTVTPHTSFEGALAVPVRVRNATHASPVYHLTIAVIAVAPVNVRPVISAQKTLSTTVNTPLEVKLADLTVTDPDDDYPEGFTLTLKAGQNYTIKERSTVVPGKDFTGNLKVPAVVNDGKADSEPFHLTISVKGPDPVSNVAPRISGQVPVSISVNQSVTLVLGHLLVTDPDNKYPDEFTLKVLPGDGYTVSNATVTPPAGFHGEMLVRIVVSDGKTDSEPYRFKITVSPGLNMKPVITGQTVLKVPQGQTLEISLSHLLVDDSDNVYPDDFRLTIHDGINYSLSGTTISPDQGFLGALQVHVSVNDGKASSDVFALHVEVVAIDVLAIVGQRPMEIAEDSSRVIQPGDLIVSDPSERYPDGYSLKVFAGENYTVKNNLIEPAEDFFGNLMVPVAVSRGDVASETYSLLIVVNAVNDAPELVNFREEPLVLTGNAASALYEGVNAYDVDDTHLAYAEIEVDKPGYNAHTDALEYDRSDSLHVVFDRETGTLFIVGRASVNEYGNVIRSVRYRYESNPDSLAAATPRTISVQLNDGKTTSARYVRMINFDTGIPFEIPTAFTPNNDNANDTWRITPAQAPAANTFVRVYDKKGQMVFECHNFETEWDGQFNGSPLPPDVYFYTIDLELSQRRISYKGVVSILR